VVECWGWDFYGQVSKIAGGASVKYEQVEAGGYHTCGIVKAAHVVEGSSNVQCWGQNSRGQCDVPAALKTAVVLTAGETHTCAVSDGGEIFCWGDNRYGQADPPPPSLLLPLPKSASSTMAIPSTSSASGVHSEIPTTFSYSAVSAGTYHSCAIATPTTTLSPPTEMVHRVICWGGSRFDPRGGPEALAYGEATPPAW
jgi:alpha-tubulin suppressor-like RCC1 family protein